MTLQIVRNLHNLHCVQNWQACSSYSLRNNITRINHRNICLLGKQLLFAWIILSIHCFPNSLSLFGPPYPEIEEQLWLALASDHTGWLKVKAAPRKVHSVTDYMDNPPESSKQRGRFDKRTSTQKALKDNLVNLTVQSECDPLLNQQLLGQLDIFQKRLAGHFPGYRDYRIWYH